MSSTAQRTTPMTVEEFHDAWPADSKPGRWVLWDGEPVCMAPASDNHNLIQTEVSFLIGAHLRATRPHCLVRNTPGVRPRHNARHNELVPDIGVSCSPPVGSRTMPDPLLLVEIMSPSNQAITRANIVSYMTIPSVREILSLDSLSLSGKLYRWGEGTGWDEAPLDLHADSVVHLRCIGFTSPMAAFYATSTLRR